jgi:hypothetical protein
MDMNGKLIKRGESGVAVNKQGEYMEGDMRVCLKHGRP